MTDAPSTRRESTKGLDHAATSGSSTPDGTASDSAQAQGGEQGTSVGEADTRAEKATSADGATAAQSDQASDAPNDSGQKPAHEAERGSNSIDLPEFDISALGTDATALERAGNTRDGRPHPISGIWMQIEGSRGSDFAPGGYGRSIVMLNPATRIAAIYREFRGSVALVLGGELALEVAPAGEEVLRSDIARGAGQVQLRRDPSLSGRFPSRGIPLGGTPPRQIEPPLENETFILDWRREGAELLLDGKRYAPATIEEFERMRRGGDDRATDEERNERAPVPTASGRDAASAKPKEAAFFGVRGGGKRFVFIVDISGSMVGPKLDRLKDELSQSVRALSEEAEFSIVFFAGAALTIEQDWMLASRDRDRALRAIAAQGCDGGTDPSGAFDFAFRTLSPIPDCIFFMTDGQIPPGIPDQIRVLNSARIPTVVHSIVVGQPAEEPLMRPLMERIAKENHGTYTFVAN